MPADLRWIAELQEVAAQANVKAKKSMSIISKLICLMTSLFVYSPKGDIFDLPDGSYLLDFAYRIHSDIGSRALWVYDQRRDQTIQLQTYYGDVIEVITRRSAKPNSDWLGWVATAHARSKIKAELNK